MPSTVHCDHLIQAEVGADTTWSRARHRTREVYEFLPHRVAPSTASASGSPGAGIIHQVVLENYAFPGGMMIGTDSHTPNAGGLGHGGHRRGRRRRRRRDDRASRSTCGGRSSSACNLTGALSGWTSPKDVILKVAEHPHRQGRHRRDRRVLRPGRRLHLRHRQGAPSATWVPRSAPPRRCSPTTPHGGLPAGHRAATPTLADAWPTTCAGPSCVADRGLPLRPGHRDRPRRSSSPMINGPHSPDLARPLAEVGAAAREAEGLAARDLAAASSARCTNSSLRGHHARRVDRPPGLGPAALQAKTQLLITPGLRADPRHHRARRPAGRLEAIGGTVLANACGPCIGQWERAPTSSTASRTRSSTASTATSRSATTATPNTLQPSSRRPDTVIALALAGPPRLRPPTDTLTRRRRRARSRSRHPSARRSPKRLRPRRGHLPGRRRPTAPASRSTVDPASDRLQLLEPFTAWDGKDYHGPAGAHEGPGQVHHRPHLRRPGPWLQVPRAPGQHLAATSSSAPSTPSTARPAR